MRLPGAAPRVSRCVALVSDTRMKPHNKNTKHLKNLYVIKHTVRFIICTPPQSNLHLLSSTPVSRMPYLLLGLRNYLRERILVIIACDAYMSVDRGPFPGAHTRSFSATSSSEFSKWKMGGQLATFCLPFSLISSRLSPSLSGRSLATAPSPRSTRLGVSPPRYLSVAAPPPRVVPPLRRRPP